MTAFACVAAAAAVLWIGAMGGPMPWQGRAAVAVGVFLTVMVTAGLMGLVFASAEGGHDEDVVDIEQR